MIAIVVPYTRCEATAAALLLADLVVSAGGDVRLVSLGPPARVHAFWDPLVVAARGDGLARGVAGCSAVVHFQPGPALLGRANLAAPRADHILVARSSLLRPCRELLCLYDRVVCPSRHVLRRVLAAPGVVGAQVHAVPFAPPPDPGPCRGRHGACFVLDRATLGGRELPALRMIGRLLDALPALSASIVSRGSWPDRPRHALRALLAAHPDRLDLPPCGDHRDVAATFRRRAWAVIPALRSDFGWYASLAQACGPRVIAYAVPPFDALLDPRRDVAVPRRPRAPVMGGAMTRSCLRLLGDDPRSALSGRMRARADLFRTFWARALDLEVGRVP